jgi:basic amino acid/polyamine antiporter, APA family
VNDPKPPIANGEWYLRSDMSSQTARLQRQVGLPGAVTIGLGSMVGTGIFVSVGIAAGISGPSVVLAIIIAALVATCNGLNSAQLAASHPVSGGTYEYGYRYLTPWLGFTAGWMFLLAKSASAATAALGFAGYFSNALALPSVVFVPLALAAVLLLTAVAASGIQRSNLMNAAIVSVTLFGLAAFVVSGLPNVSADHFLPFFAPSGGEVHAVGAFLHACALMFVAYTGYGRIATLGEEVREPRRTIPRAIAATMLVTTVLYVAVAGVAVGASGASTLGQVTAGALEARVAPLSIAAQGFALPLVSQVVAMSAVTAMLGVLLNLILGLSRVALAMGRRGDMPIALAQLNCAGTTPTWAVWAVGVAISVLVLIGDVQLTWSFSAFTVLIYYALTNAAALRLPTSQRIFPTWVAWTGLAACLFLAFWVEPAIWLIGLGCIGLGLIWHAIARALYRPAI